MVAKKFQKVCVLRAEVEDTAFIIETTCYVRCGLGLQRQLSIEHVILDSTNRSHKDKEMTGEIDRGLTREYCGCVSRDWQVASFTFVSLFISFIYIFICSFIR